MIDPRLELSLQPVAERQGRLVLGCKLAGCWAGVALVGFGCLALQRSAGWTSAWVLTGLVLLGLIASIIVAVRHGQMAPAWRELSRQIEVRFPELQGCLLTAVQQEPKGQAELDYLQQRVVEEAVRQSYRQDWAAAIPGSAVALSVASQLLALGLLGVVLWQMRPASVQAAVARKAETGINVTPGDITLERGSSLVVLARFDGPLPASVDLVIGDPSTNARHITLVKSLADPVFGGSVPEVSSNMVYRVEYAGKRTRDFKVGVFEHPRLERADADLTFPEYTRQGPKHIPDTRRLSAVEGSHVDLSLQLNKPVVSAKLVGREKDKEQQVIPLLVETNRATAALKQFPLEASGTYDLQLVDADGRTNKLPAHFVFEALKNRLPELHLTAPHGDVRPSSLEEITFDGTVWDDFGVPSYGLAYTRVGQETKFIELGHEVPSKEKRPFRYMLRLEDLGLQPDQLVSWFIWADDIGPDGQTRRTTGDLFFAEVRPFDEIFREGQGAEAQSGQEQSGEKSGEQGGQGNKTGKLAELQKQIISATWKLQRDQNAVRSTRREAGSRIGESVKPAENSAAPTKKVGTRRIVPEFIGAFHGRRSFGGGLPQFMGQRAGVDTLPAADPPKRAPAAGPAPTPKYEDDAGVVRDSQAQVLEQAKATLERQQDPRAAALWSRAIKDMEDALARLERVANSPALLAEALLAEQAAYQALLKLQEHEYQVSRARSQSKGQQSSSQQQQQMQRQLDQLELSQSENRYETQRQAQSPQSQERKEQLQVQNRLQELARRQQDLNDRLKELQTALQEAKTEQERAEIQRRLKRLQEEEQQMLADVDELRQRMDRPENQSRMANERRQLDETRQDVQRAAEAAGQGSPSQALASGTRAQSQLQQLRDQMRKENSSQFAEDLREMRAEARELARREEEISKKLETLDEKQRRTLSEASNVTEVQDALARQKGRLTNIVARATQISQQAENSQPLLSRELYDMVRKFTQDEAKNVKEAQEQLLNQGLMTRSLLERMKETADRDGAKSLAMTEEILRQGYLPQAGQAEQRARAGIEDVKRGVERAAGSVLGDDTEALRLAQQELDQLTDQLKREMAFAEGVDPKSEGPKSEGNPKSEIRNGQRRGASNEIASAEQRGTNAFGRGRQSASTNQMAGAGRQGQAQAQGEQPGQEQGQGQGQEQGEQQGQGQQQQGQGEQGQQGQGQQGQGQQGQGQQGQGQQGQGQQGQGQQGQGQQPGQGQGQGRGQGQPKTPGQGGQQAEPGTPQNDAQPGEQPGENGQNPGGGQPQNAQKERSPQTPQDTNRQQTSRRPGQVANGGGGGGGDRGGQGSNLRWDFNRFMDADPKLQSGPLLGDNFVPWSDRLRDVEDMIEMPDLRNAVAVARERAQTTRQQFKRDQKKPDWAVVRLQVVNPLVEVRDRIAEELARRETKDALVPIDRDPVPTRYTEMVRRYYEQLGKEK